MLLRSFARTKEMYDRSDEKHKLPASKMLDLLTEIEFDLIKEEE